MKQLIALDIDGTLLPTRNSENLPFTVEDIKKLVSKKSHLVLHLQKIIAELQSHGIQFAISTGRGAEHSVFVNKQLLQNRIQQMICESGTVFCMYKNKQWGTEPASYLDQDALEKLNYHREDILNHLESLGAVREQKDVILTVTIPPKEGMASPKEFCKIVENYIQKIAPDLQEKISISHSVTAVDVITHSVNPGVPVGKHTALQTLFSEVDKIAYIGDARNDVEAMAISELVGLPKNAEKDIETLVEEKAIEFGRDPQKISFIRTEEEDLSGTIQFLENFFKYAEK